MSWRGSRVSVVFPTYNERDSIRAAIVDFASTGVVDEIVVVNNNAADGTSDEVAAAVNETSDGTVVREVKEYRQGYGYAIIGGVGPAEFYAKTVGAIPIEGSEPGIYRGLL